MNTLFGMFARIKGTGRSIGKQESVKPEYDPEKGLDLSITFFGDVATGAKTSYLKRYIRDRYDDNYEPTIGMCKYVKSIIVREKTVNIEIWDVSGNEKFLSYSLMYTRNCDGIVLGYDITNRASFDTVRRRITSSPIEFPNFGKKVLMIIGNKVDIDATRKVSREEGEELAREFNVPLFFEGKCQARSFQFICCYFYFYFSLSENRVQRQ